MATWRCPFCSTPQPETSRCWVCHRSSTSCGTCRQFRRSVAASVGYCGLDRRHEPLRGDEVRACWEDGALPVAPEPAIPGLLDLLTERALTEPAPLPQAAAPAIDPLEPANPARRLRPASGVVVHREWVEVEA
jgi:hypothetical protein